MVLWLFLALTPLLASASQQPFTSQAIDRAKLITPDIDNFIKSAIQE
jgi:hypothetical protein